MFPIGASDETDPTTFVMYSDSAARAILTAEADTTTTGFSAICKELTITFTKNIHVPKKD
jgi:hypothetical protein